MSGSSRWISDTHTKKWRIRGIPEMKIPSFLWYFLHFFFCSFDCDVYVETWANPYTTINRRTGYVSMWYVYKSVIYIYIYINHVLVQCMTKGSSHLRISAWYAQRTPIYIFCFFFVLINIRQSDGPTHPHTLCRPTFFFSLFMGSFLPWMALYISWREEMNAKK